MMPERRVPCPACGAAMVEGARKCRACKRWLSASSDAGVERSAPASSQHVGPGPRIALLAATSVATVMAFILASHRSPVGEAPPLTPMSADPASLGVPHPAAIGDEIESAAEIPPPKAPQAWRTVRDFRVGDFHPLDVEYSPKGSSLYVSGDDATLREYRVPTGELLHQASVPAQGDQIRLLFDRYVAVLRHQDASRIPVMDTTTWDRDPVLLDVGKSPGDIVELPDGKSVVTASIDGKRVSRFELPQGTRVANITLPHATGQLFLVRSEGRPYVAAMGALEHGGAPAGAWLDLFDPSESPFGATRRSISIGRDPRAGATTADGGAVFLPDHVSNTAVLLRVSGTTQAKTTAVGQTPEAAFVMLGDRYGVTINSKTRTASVVNLTSMKVESTLMLEGVPRAGVTSPDQSMLFVVLGGTEWPPRGSGVAVIAGDPPKVVASLPTGEGACAVAVAKDGMRAAVANYWSHTVTVLER